MENFSRHRDSGCMRHGGNIRSAEIHGDILPIVSFYRRDLVVGSWRALLRYDGPPGHHCEDIVVGQVSRGNYSPQSRGPIDFSDVSIAVKSNSGIGREYDQADGLPIRSGKAL